MPATDQQQNVSVPFLHAHRIAEAVRAACLRAALDGYEQASMSGLCHEGAWECAVGAIRSVDVEVVIREALDGKDDAYASNRDD